MAEVPEEIRETLPAEPSRATGRKYFLWIILLAVVQSGLTVVIAVYSPEALLRWPALAVVNLMVIAAYLIKQSGTSIDLNGWMKSATKMVEARYRK